VTVDTGRRSRATAGDTTAPPAAPRLTRAQVASGVAIAGVLVVSTVLRFWTRSDLWFDEALSVNISKLSLGQIAEALRHDGHPPLYYYLLHFWTEAFGTRDVAVRALSGFISLATLPVAWFAGRRLGGRPVAWLTMLFLATSPYAFRYATEARMYSMVIFLVFAGYLALRRALEVPSLPRLALVALITGALSLSQYWDLYLLAVVGVALAYMAIRAGDVEMRRAARRAVVAVASGALLFVPWMPVFLDQLAHTGTPWGEPQYPWVNLPNTLIAFAGTDRDGEAYLLGLLLLLLPLVAVFGRGLDRNRIELDLRTQRPVRWEAAALLGALLLGTVLSYLSSTTYQPRYAATVFPLFLLLVAFGATVFLDARIRLVTVALVVALGFAGGVRNVVTDRTQAAQSADIIVAEAKAGDLVVYCPDQVGPSVSRLLRDVRGLRQLTFPDFAPPQRVNWSDYVDRIGRVSPQSFADAIVRRAGNATIWYVLSPGFFHFKGKCDTIAARLGAVRSERDRVGPDDSFYEFEGLIEFTAK
jgi:hypothetical protein